jgi:tol-pal system protein YbgF
MTASFRFLAPGALALALLGAAPAAAQMSASDLVVRLDRLENQIRQLTGAVEQLQFRNRELEGQLRRMHEDVEFRFQEQGKGGTRPPPPRAQAAPPAPATAPQAPPVHAAPAPPPAPAAPPQRRADVFDPGQNPTAPGAPHTLGSITTGPPGPAAAAASPPVIAAEEDEGPPVGVPGGRQAGAPLDLSTMSAEAASDPQLAPPRRAGPQANASPLPPPPPRNPSGTGAQQQAMLPPTATPKDEYDLAYGYLLRKDYAQAEEGFRDFLTKHPSDRLVAEANYWLGESLFQRQRYRDAAESFLTVSTRYDKSAKAPDALLRLGQSLAALKEKEQACATLAEVPRRYPRASASVKQTAEREQKRAGC